MAKGFFLRMAASNLRRGRRTYLPYFVAASIMCAMFFLIANMVMSGSIANAPNGEMTERVMTIGLVVMSLFLIAYMFYINSFLIRGRKKEFGLYGILGLEKRHVGRVIFWENLMLTLAAVITGVAFGCVFGRLIFMGLLYAMRVSPDSRFILSSEAMLFTCAVFFGVFLLTTGYNFLSVRLANPIDLINGEKKGEKRPRLLPLRAILGLLCLAGGYTLAAMTRSDAFALKWFWPAVLMVIFGTNLFFSAGLVLILERMKKRPGFYYREKNFVAVSGLSYRMKRNAAGLANICILSTMVLVTVSACTAMYLGQESSVRTMYANDLEASFYSHDDEAERAAMDAFQERAREMAAEKGVEVETEIRYRAMNSGMDMCLEDGVLRQFTGYQTGNFDGYDWRNVFAVHVMSLDGFNRVAGRSDALGEGEVLLLTEKPITGVILPEGWRVKEIISGTPLTRGKISDNGLYVVTLDEEQGMALKQTFMQYEYEDAERARRDNYSETLILNLGGDADAVYEMARGLQDEIQEIGARTLLESGGYSRSYGAAELYRRQGYAIFGGLIFMGAFFAVLFLTNTVLIIYFKQLSEGYEDRERFVIMQKVGMSDKEVRSAISRQILIVFFLPLVTALIHLAFATNMLVHVLSAFALTDVGLTYLCVGATGLCFALVYALVYRRTAATYYNIVKW